MQLLLAIIFILVLASMQYREFLLPLLFLGVTVNPVPGFVLYPHFNQHHDVTVHHGKISYGDRLDHKLRIPLRFAYDHKEGTVGIMSSDDLVWVSLTEDGGVKKAILRPCQDENDDDDNEDRTLVIQQGFSGIISYQGRWIDIPWSTDEVIQCWLLQQQGISKDDPLVQAFQDYYIDELKLIDTEQFFTETFVRQTLGVTSNLACKKLVMAARRLGKIRQETIGGTMFDENDHYPVSQGGSKKLIRGMDIALSTMMTRTATSTVGEIAKIRIRSDYGYGAEGYRRRDGQVMVPPYCTLEFHIEVKSQLS